ncbi:LPS O-antigen chain length determinant protein WzzB [Actinobacillus arthritidis]|uniref:LPS O-antigen chain length determinant protein WzzB n=1 Tax=Actinobacillus arthritidis TaxID=157339 RepID=UPI002443647E|nr:Wzz/FepE/Etk N-terminal domain-containing protein [Actinobacillus arthritidis]WGE89325.1 Wzz/FepE/Etk N-terminal domain-containing protein [Actinobacillus arthritidis]
MATLEQVSNEQVSNQTNEEIDLAELVRVLWKKKLLIAIVTFIFTALATIYAFTAKEKWTSQAEIITPRVTDISEYLSLRKEYNLIIGSEFKENEIRNELSELFGRYVLSYDEAIAFFKTTDTYKKLSETESEETLQRAISEFATESLKVIKPDAKKDPNALGSKIAISSDTALSAQTTLNDFIRHISDTSFNFSKNEFIYWVKESVSSLNYEKEVIEQDQSIQRKVQIQNLETALDMAKKAGIKEYSSALSSNSSVANLAVSDTKIPLSDSKLSDGTYLFMLGEKNLQAQLDIAKTKEIVYSPRYYQIQEQLLKLNTLLPKVEKVVGQAYSYISSPELPVKRDWPKRFILLLIGAVIGSVLSSLWVLGKHILSQK